MTIVRKNCAHLLFCDINRFINYYPDGTFPAARMSGGTFVGDVMIGVGQQRSHRYMAYGGREAYLHHENETLTRHKQHINSLMGLALN